ncbi:hypothetical protein [Lyngbya confervoides]|uniref:Uncharacterized protein n=1 Tax=Lyngbya confervoides BDU141951 TaxID=1574623 RepID=A0ABD4T3J4_9CYAN|nr:hypothetical protein [Lyngbya confervoides]MCM1982991.1 hypothetical protein [Lyngbya confervoides BDU141951]
MSDRSVPRKLRNRKRSKRRAIFCPTHGTYLDSVSQKHSLYTDKAAHLRERGVGKRAAMLLVANSQTVLLQGEWLEQFWCDRCQEACWYHVRKVDKEYFLRPAPRSLWEQATGVIHPEGNPSVGEFTRRQSRAQGKTQRRDFAAVLGR